MTDYWNNINWDCLIQNLSGLGGFLTSIITLVTLIVLIKQRKDSFRPRVIFGDRLYAICKPKNDEILKTLWEVQYPKENQNVFDFGFDLHNVGVGVAENVIIRESFDYKSAIGIIKKLDLNNEFKIIKQENSIEIRTTFDDSFMISFINQKPRELGTFLMGKHDIPNTYIFNDTCLNFLSCFDYLTRNNLNRHKVLEAFPKFHFTVIYHDIEGKRYKSLYECRISSLLSDSYTFEFIKK